MCHDLNDDSNTRAPPSAPQIPGYQIIDELGRGGMGVVYKARQLKSGRFVALKLIRDGALAGPQERARFRIEAEAVSRMHHPNIVAIHEVGDEQGHPYFAMDFVAGRSLDKTLKGEPLSGECAAELIRTLALAIAHAHSNQIVHRDLKPSNVLLLELDDSATERFVDRPSSFVPMIVDFGLAKRLDTDSTAWTQAGAIIGTTSYMAPEQASGKSAEIGPAADIYALGAILYELLTGRPPFQADAIQEIIEQLLHREPTPPSRLNAGVPQDLETICLKCLEKEPARRYSCAADLTEDLGRFLAGERVAAAPLGHLARVRRIAEHDGFDLVEEIGRGPGSRVFRAVYGPLRQSIAVKLFDATPGAKEKWDDRLRRAAEIWSVLSHPQIVKAQRVGWWDDSPYLAMEHIPGGSISEQLTGRPYPVHEALSLVERVADIVVYLHRQGVVHGNLKPSNVLLAAGGIPRLADLHPTGGAISEEGPTGLGYAPPERIAKPDAEPRPYSDIYGLGLILYETLAGRPPFAGASAKEIVEQVTTQDPFPPSQFNTAVTPPLDSLCLRCLRKNPWRRFERVYDLWKWLRTLREKCPRGR
jgi:serine/threonine protein kinase